MKRKTANWFRLGVTVLFLLAMGCGSNVMAGDDEKEPKQVKGTGTVTWIDLEGGFWGIVGDGGGRFDPMRSLPKEFRSKGLKVRFEATVEKGAISTHQWGRIIKITKIEKAE